MGTAPTSQPATPRVKALNCPNCGAALALRSFDQAVTVVCQNCNSILDAKDPNLQVLQQFEAAQKDQPRIPLGTRGKLRGDAYEVIGFERRTITVEGVQYSWHEYLLFNPYKGFRYLTEYNGHWNDIKPIKGLPTEVRRFGKPQYEYLGERYTHFQTAVAETTYVLGEFPWQIRVGERVEGRDYVSPPRILSAEITPEETVWSLGEYITGAEVWKNFNLPGHPPAAVGVYENQPSPYQGRIRGIWKVCGLLLAGMLALAVFFAIFASHKYAFYNQYQFDPRSPGEHSFVTDIFSLEGRPDDAEIIIHTNLHNNWTYFNLALIDNDNEHAYNFGREVSYYEGTDGDGHWTEGHPNDSVILPDIPPGHYYLRVEPEMDAKATPVAYQIWVRRGVPVASFFWIAAGLLVLPAVLLSWRSVKFESRRWSESDYSSS